MFSRNHAQHKSLISIIHSSIISGMKQEKKDLEDRLASVTLRAEQNQETSRREERLLLSAVYDVGLRIMDNKVYTTCP